MTQRHSRKMIVRNLGGMDGGWNDPCSYQDRLISGPPDTSRLALCNHRCRASTSDGLEKYRGLTTLDRSSVGFRAHHATASNSTASLTDNVANRCRQSYTTQPLQFSSVRACIQCSSDRQRGDVGNVQDGRQAFRVACKAGLA